MSGWAFEHQKTNLWQPSIFNIPVVHSSFLTSTADSSTAGKCVGLLLDPDAVRAFQTPLTLRSSNIPNFDKSLLTIGALQEFAFKVIDPDRVVKIVCAAS